MNSQHRRPVQWSRNQNYSNWNGPNLIRHPPPPPYVPRTFTPPPPQPYVPPPFINHPPPPPYVPTFGPPMQFPEWPVGAMPFSGAGMFPPEPQEHIELRAKIVNQIDYYFSFDNLITDLHLREHMDEQGWVRIEVIAGFKKVSHLTDNIQLILDALRSSTMVEVVGNKIRKRDDWKRWILPGRRTANHHQGQGTSNGQLQ